MTMLLLLLLLPCIYKIRAFGNSYEISVLTKL